MIIPPDKTATRGVTYVILTQVDADGAAADVTTCPGCRVAVILGQTCRCPMRWTGGAERSTTADAAAASRVG